MKINSERYENFLLELSKITDPFCPYTRRSFSPMFEKGREWLTHQMKKLGLSVEVDVSGNLIGTLIGKKTLKNNQNTQESVSKKAKNTIALGSHSDTVPNGGRYDGIAGVIAGLECVAALQENNIKLSHDLQIIDFLAEEPSEWGISCIGSRGISGFLDEKMLKLAHPKSGELLENAINRMGGDTANLQKAEHIKVFFELHIEQGKVLESQGVRVGVVNSIVGIMRIAIELIGEPNHAGTTPMDLRHDAGNAACRVAVLGDDLAREISRRKKGYFVATCGQIAFTPNASNVVCGSSKIVFDVRSDTSDYLDEFLQCLREGVAKICSQTTTTLKSFEILTNTRPVFCNKDLMNLIERTCHKQNTPFLIMPSGAGHDAAFMSHLAPMAMIFVPSIEGKSHCPEEFTSQDDLALGVNILFESILEYDKNF